MDVKTIRKDRSLNVLGVTLLLIISLFFVFTIHASAASSYFSYSGSFINGKNNGQFHSLNSGDAYLTVRSHSGATANVKLYRQVSFWFDSCYGGVNVYANSTYHFPKKADTNSGSYYLIISAGSDTSGSGVLHN